MYTGFSFCNLFIFDFNNNCLTIGDFCFMYETSSVGCQLYFRRKCLWSATKDNMCVYLMKTIVSKCLLNFLLNKCRESCVLSRIQNLILVFNMYNGKFKPILNLKSEWWAFYCLIVPRPFLESHQNHAN